MRRLIEISVLTLSAMAILTVAGVLVAEALDENKPPNPQVEVHLEAMREGSLGWIVPLTVTNGGDVAVEEAVFEATATVNGAAEMSEVTILLLPPGTDVDVEVGFSGRPEPPIEVRLVGYLLP